MSLLAKKHLIKNLIKPGWIFFIPVFFGCETSQDQGIRYDLDSNANVRFEEFVLPVTNFVVDSLATGEENKILTGKYTDPITGQVSAEGYFQYFYQTGPLPADSLEYDSIVLILQAQSTIPQVSDITQEFSVWEISSTLLNGAVYLASLKQDRTDSIGLFSKAFNSSSDSVFQVKLSDAFGQRIFTKLDTIPEEEEQSVTSMTFKNLALVPENGSQGISMLDLTADTTNIILYSSPKSGADTTYQTLFRVAGANYSHLVRDKTGSPMEGIADTTSFNLSDGRAVLDPLAGVTMAYSIEEIARFFTENPNVIINSAIISLEIEPEDQRDLMSRFYSFFRKADGSIFGPAVQTQTFRNLLLNDDGYLFGDASPSISVPSGEENKVLIPCTLFFQQLSSEYSTSGKLRLPGLSNNAPRDISDLAVISTADVTLQRAVFAAEGVKLRIYFTEVN